MPMATMTLLMYMCNLFSLILTALLEVAQFWRDKLLSWLWSKSPKATLLHALNSARSFEEWEAAALPLDEVLSTDVWRQAPASRHYDYRLIMGRLNSLITAREEDDVLSVVNIIRSGLVRNLANITSPRLYDRAYAGTKILIEEYIAQLGLSIQYVTALQTVPRHPSRFDAQAKLELLHDTRQAFGRSTLVLQGGAVFGLCHLGVIKALYLRGLLPRIITGTATGAMIAAIVGIHTEAELLPFLDGEGIDLSAFDRLNRDKKDNGYLSLFARENGHGWWSTMARRVKRYIREEYFLDLKVLEDCVRTNVGDMTFEEAYAKTKTILNITIAISGRGGFPNLLNYLTAPNVLIWSAAAASNVSSTTSDPITLYCKDETGQIVPWPNSEGITWHSWRQISYSERESPLHRLAELFNVNHFIVSQARPYLVPLLRTELQQPGQVHGHQWNPTRPILRLMALEFRHRLKQLDYLGLLPTVLRRLLIDEDIPGPNITLLPDLSLMDLTKVFHQAPTREHLRSWILKGERGVWPAVAAIKVRCTVEMELEKGYQMVRRRPSHGTPE